MNTVNIIISNSNLNSFENMITLNKSHFDDKFSQNFVLVPDKFSLNAERRIFELLNIKSTFNIDVVSFNRLAYRVFNKENLNILSKRKGLILVNKIILENKDKLTTFNKIVGKKGLTENIYETIMQFKSSGILPNEVATNDTQSHLFGKLQDIKLIYEEYEKTLEKGLIDEPHRLKLLKDRIKISDLVKNSSFFIGMFDNFTYLQYECIKELIKYAKSVTISLSASTFQSNSDIYINENLQNIINLCRENNLKYEIQNVASSVKKEVEHISKNLFSIHKENLLKTNDVKVVALDNIDDEIEFICKMIKGYVNLKGYNYNDFNIAVGGLESLKSVVKKYFDKYEIPYYLDCQDKMSSSILIKFVTNLIDCYSNNFEKSKVLNLIKNPFIRFDREVKDKFENYVDKYGIDYSMFFKTFVFETDSIDFCEIEKLRQQVCDLLSNAKEVFENSKYSYEFSSGIIKLLDLVEYDKTIEDICKLNLSNKVKKDLSSSYDKLITALNDVDEMFENEISFNDYREMIMSMFENESFTNIPIGTTDVFIADAVSGYFHKEKILFVVNCIEGVLPNYQNDCGIITDSEILKLNSINLLSPSIQFINKKEKNRLFNLLSTFNEKLFVTYSLSSGNSTNLPSEIIRQMQEMFDNIKIDARMVYSFFETEFGKENAYKCNLGITNNAVMSNIKQTETIKLDNCLNDSDLYETLSYNLDFNVKNAFDRDKVSISKIEKYNKCPFYSFCQDGLKLKEKDIYGMKVVDVGTILHSVAEQFGKLIISLDYNVENIDIETKAVEIYNKVLNNENYSHLKLNNLQNLSLKNESINLCKVIVYQVKNSNYKIKKLEYRFSDFEIDNFKINGVIDRVDECENYFNVIDYKTGRDKFSYADIFVGKKLQLLVYSYIYERLSNKQISGLYYMPISNKFVGDKEDFYKKYKLSGVTLNSEGIIKRIDKKLLTQNESDIINVKYTKSGELSKFCLNNILDNEELNLLKEYAINMLIKTSKEMESGQINPIPLENSCDYCPYYSICSYEKDRRGERKLPTNISKENFKKEQK